jgi:small subunit ribosomal protein S6
MAEAPIRLYEGLFLLSQSSAGDVPAALEFVTEVLKRADAEILVLRKWDERKLTYPIRGQKRGVFVLAYFNVRSVKLGQIDRDFNLSEKIARHLIIGAEFMGETELELAKRETTLSTEAKLRAPDSNPANSIMVPAEANFDA